MPLVSSKMETPNLNKTKSVEKPIYGSNSLHHGRNKEELVVEGPLASLKRNDISKKLLKSSGSDSAIKSD